MTQSMAIILYCVFTFSVNNFYEKYRKLVQKVSICINIGCLFENWYGYWMKCHIAFEQQQTGQTKTYFFNDVWF